MSSVFSKNESSMLSNVQEEPNNVNKKIFIITGKRISSRDMLKLKDFGRVLDLQMIVNMPDVNVFPIGYDIVICLMSEQKIRTWLSRLSDEILTTNLVMAIPESKDMNDTNNWLSDLSEFINVTAQLPKLSNTATLIISLETGLYIIYITIYLRH